jgi:predicted transcriptional regulator
MKLSHVSKKLDFTVQETSRNISRLAEANLIIRAVDGSYSLTPYGYQSLEMLKGFEFLSKHSQYFINHTLARLPRSFFSRIGDLLESNYSEDVMMVFYEAEKMMQESEEYLFLLSDQHLVSATPHISSAYRRGVEVKILLPTSLHYPEGYFEQEIVKETMKDYYPALESGQLQERWIDEVDTLMGVSEKSGRIFFPKVSGEFDYHGFMSTDDNAVEYIKELFMHYWNLASTKIPDHVLEQLPDNWKGF